MGPTVTLTPVEIIDSHIGVVTDVTRRLIAENERLRRSEHDLDIRLRDALDRIAELIVESLAKDQLIEELRAVRGSR